MGSLGVILSIISTLLPEIISLAKSFKDTPVEKQKSILSDIRSAFVAAKSKVGNTKPIEDIING